MKQHLKNIVSLFVLLLPGLLFSQPQWHTVQSPNTAATQIYGSYANGCISGAVALPAETNDYIAMRPSRNRVYGHPDLIKFVLNYSAYAAHIGQKLLVGDLSQPRGGPMNYGHSSHQIGLDVDFWFQLVDKSQSLNFSEKENREFLSLVNKPAGQMNWSRWKPEYGALLEQAAKNPKVERIFINPIIKQTMCEMAPNQPWLSKLRPWWGHDAHFHVRLKCPENSPYCKPQNPPPQESGCDANLAQWIDDQANPKPAKPGSTQPPKAAKVLPQQCNAVLNS